MPCLFCHIILTVGIDGLFFTSFLYILSQVGLVMRHLLSDVLLKYFFL